MSVTISINRSVGHRIKVRRVDLEMTQGDLAEQQRRNENERQKARTRVTLVIDPVHGDHRGEPRQRRGVQIRQGQAVRVFRRSGDERNRRQGEPRRRQRHPEEETELDEKTRQGGKRCFERDAGSASPRVRRAGLGPRGERFADRPRQGAGGRQEDPPRS